MHWHQRRRARGMVLIYVMIALTAMLGLCSLAVDFARVQIVKTQLQFGAEQAARHAVRGLSDGISAAEDRAIDAANDNLVENTALSLNESDIEFGTWNFDNGTFTVLSGSARSSANAVRVTARRTRARRNPVALNFAGIIGRSTCDVVASAIAVPKASDPFPIVGLQFIESESGATSRFDSCDSTNGPYVAALATHNADVATNGDVKLRTGVTVYGNAYAGVGKTFTSNPTVTGSKGNLVRALSYDNATAPPGIATNNDNHKVPAANLDASRNFLIKNNKTLTLPGGTYYFNRFQMLNTSRVTFTGPATIYVTDRVDIDSTLVTHDSKPKNLKLVSLSNVTKPTDCEIEIEADGNVYIDVYAPQCEVDVEDNAQVFGFIIGGSLEISDSAFIHYDIASGRPNGGVATETLIVR